MAKKNRINLGLNKTFGFVQALVLGQSGFCYAKVWQR